MKRILIPALLIFFLLSCSREARLIPRGKMADIYADMFVADQWLDQNFKASRVADTSYVYEAVFQKYGYTSEDYRHSVEYYIQEPDKFARILRQTVLILEDRIAEQKAEIRELKKLEAQQPDTLIQFDFSQIWIFEGAGPRKIPKDSVEYFQQQEEYFIMGRI